MTSPRSVMGARIVHCVRCGASRCSLAGWDHLHRLGTHRLLRRATVERENGRELLGVASLDGLAAAVGRAVIHLAQGGVREADQGSPGQVGDEERHLRGAQRHPQLAGHRLDGIHR